MAGTTTLGFPYPSSGDKVADDATKIQELAQFVDDQTGLARSGSVTSGVLVAATAKTVAVVFATAFPAAGPVPKVVAVPQGSGATLFSVQVNNVTRSGFDLNMRRETGTASFDAYYIAHAV